MSPERIELAIGVYFYPHARRVIWRDGSGFPDMSWPLPDEEAHDRVHRFAVESADPALRSSLMALLSVASAYAQMTLTDGRGKRDHVCAMLRSARRRSGGTRTP